MLQESFTKMSLEKKKTELEQSIDGFLDSMEHLKVFYYSILQMPSAEEKKRRLADFEKAIRNDVAKKHHDLNSEQAASYTAEYLRLLDHVLDMAIHVNNHPAEGELEKATSN